MDDQQGQQLIVTEPRTPASTQALQVIQPMSVTAITNRIQEIQRIMSAVMKPNVHYGIITGTKKNSLWRPGAEILAVTFRLSTRPQVELLQEDGEMGYRVATPTYDPYENLLTIGWGECWTTEEKFAWREAICDEEWEETDAARRRKKWWKDDFGEVGKTLQIRQNPSDLRNNVLKRGCKRSFVDGIIKALAASDIFDQQLEEDDVPGSDRSAAKAKPKAGALLQGVLKQAVVGAQGKPGKVVIACESVDLELTFFMDQAPGVLKAAPDWNALKERSCTFSYEQRESKGKVYRNLKTLAWLEGQAGQEIKGGAAGELEENLSEQAPQSTGQQQSYVRENKLLLMAVGKQKLSDVAVIGYIKQRFNITFSGPLSVLVEKLADDEFRIALTEVEDGTVKAFTQERAA